MSELILKLLEEYGFTLESKTKDFDRYKRNVVIQTQPQILVINGVRKEIPGKIGKIDIFADFLKNTGEVKGVEIDKMSNMYIYSKFKDVEFQYDHIISKDDGDIQAVFLKFINMFGMI